MKIFFKYIMELLKTWVTYLTFLPKIIEWVLSLFFPKTTAYVTNLIHNTQIPYIIILLILSTFMIHKKLNSRLDLLLLKKDEELFKEFNNIFPPEKVKKVFCDILYQGPHYRGDMEELSLFISKKENNALFKFNNKNINTIFNDFFELSNKFYEDVCHNFYTQDNYDIYKIQPKNDRDRIGLELNLRATKIYKKYLEFIDVCKESAIA